MKSILPIFLGSVLAIPLAQAQTKSKDPHAEALEVLRRSIQEYDKDPAAAAAKARAAVKDARPAGIPSSTPPTAEPAVTTAPPVTPAPTPVPAPAPTPAPVVAAPAATTTVAPAPAPAPVTPVEQPEAKALVAPAPSFQEKEREYLEGKISAKDFQKYLQAQKIPTGKGGEATAPTPAPATAPAGTPATTATPPARAVVNDVEQKLQELEKARQEREKAATNAAPASTGPKTKRQRLDDLLRQLVEGKISNEDYKAQREKILSAPE